VGGALPEARAEREGALKGDQGPCSFMSDPRAT
jgi:hypothetical protein